MTAAQMTHGLPLASTPTSPRLLLELPLVALRRPHDDLVALTGRDLPCLISAEDI